MKSILLPVHPELLANILNGDANILIRKLFPKDYVGWVYIYCSKGKPSLVKSDHFGVCTALGDVDTKKVLNGKVVARFWCDKVEEIKLEPVEDYSSDTYEYMTKTLDEDDLLEKSCLHTLDLSKYLHGKKGYAIHISKLEVFDKPKELSEFWHKCEQKEKDRKCANCPIGWALWNDGHKSCEDHHIIYETPKNYCYIEIEE